MCLLEKGDKNCRWEKELSEHKRRGREKRSEGRRGRKALLRRENR